MILTTLINLDGPTGWVVMLLPFAMLAVVVAGVVVSRDRAAVEADAGTEPDRLPHRQPAGPDADLMREERQAAPRATAPAPAPPSTPAMQPAPPSPRGTSATSPPVTVARPATARGSEVARPPTPRSEPPPSAVPGRAPPWRTDHEQAPPASGGPLAQATADLEAQLGAAEERFDDAAVARLSLALARSLIASDAPGQTTQAHLRRAIILASRLGDNDTHAAARLELGDLLGADGDMTTACEHWQIARQIFWDRGDKDELADVDRRMMANGCPTDWVLNDF